jgi:hypothetical protein
MAPRNTISRLTSRIDELTETFHARHDEAHTSRQPTRRLDLFQPHPALRLVAAHDGDLPRARSAPVGMYE